MPIRPRGLILLIALLLGALARPAAAQSTPVLNPANGHWYQAVRVAGAITWDDARAAAQSLSYAGYPGHLVTITSAAEQQFVAGTVLAGFPTSDQWWLGGYQDTSAPDYVEPAGGWRGVTGEPWSFTFVRLCPAARTRCGQPAGQWQLRAAPIGRRHRLPDVERR